MGHPRTGAPPVADYACLKCLTSLLRIVGFEDLGNTDQFETATLEWKLLNSGTSFGVSTRSVVNFGEHRRSR